MIDRAIQPGASCISHLQPLWVPLCLAHDGVEASYVKVLGLLDALGCNDVYLYLRLRDTSIGQCATQGHELVAHVLGG